jgi:hypothetical protein
MKAAEFKVYYDFNIFDKKALGIAALVLGFLSLFIALYSQLEIIPVYETIDKKNNLIQFEREMWRNYADKKFLYGSIALFLGTIAGITGLIVGFRKNRMGWFALCLGLITIFLSVIQTTNIFN